MSRISERYVPKNFVYYTPDWLLKLGFRWEVKHYRIKTYTKVKGQIVEKDNIKGGYTKVILKNPTNNWVSVGISVCDSDDIFVNKIGFFNALTDALVKLVKASYPTFVVTTPLFKINKKDTVYNYIKMVQNEKLQNSNVTK